MAVLSEEDRLWKLRLERFFYDRAEEISGVPTLLDHVRISAKDPRIAGREDYHADLIGSLIDQLDLDQTKRVLEIGCASGYIACGLALNVGLYDGVDLASPPLDVARRMKLANATFQQSDGGALPFENESFDAAFAYDVLSNFPRFDLAEPLLDEMLRVVRPGGRFMAGSVTDAQTGQEFQQHVYKVATELEEKYGPVPVVPEKKQGPLAQFAKWARRIFRPGERPPTKDAGQAVNYNFQREDFETFAQSRGCTLEFRDVHDLNPYKGFRFNAVMTKPLS
ncbi:class I SAM-dependent methyltransferase [Pyruvatibacter sp.]|uniref:class I SAM-dependent methyltransferase n=1 Tax=Pyruvatibacter sp. TaxID=1981328 RepID=UPI0032EB8BB5